jgi:hypothetical protein
VITIRFTPSKPLSKPVVFAGADTLRVILTAQEGSSAKRPHQAFLLLKDTQSGLDVSYPFSVKENGKSRVELVCDSRIELWNQQQANTRPHLDPEGAAGPIPLPRRTRRCPCCDWIFWKL